MKRPIFLISFFSMYAAGSKPLTSPAIWQAKPDTSNDAILAIPLRPARTPAQVSSEPIPSGDTRPTPVMTTLRDTAPLFYCGSESGILSRVGILSEGYFLDVLASI